MKDHLHHGPWGATSGRQTTGITSMRPPPRIPGRARPDRLSSRSCKREAGPRRLPKAPDVEHLQNDKDALTFYGKLCRRPHIYDQGPISGLGGTAPYSSDGHQAQEKVVRVKLDPPMPWLRIVEMKKRPMERAETPSLEMSGLLRNIHVRNKKPAASLSRTNPHQS
jgi:hypothetical protein